MRHIYLIAALALTMSAGAAYAQTAATDPKTQVAIDKARAAKAKAEAKAKAKADKAKAKGAKGTAKAADAPQVVIANAGDSLAYVFGVMQSQGLRQYMTQQLHVDSAYQDAFIRGIQERVVMDANDKEQMAYLSGINVGAQIVQMTQQMGADYYSAQPGKTIDPRIVSKGIVEGLTGTAAISTDSAQMTFQTQMTQRQQANKEALWGANRKAGEEWLAANKAKEGVVTLPSGLQYKILTQGTGDVPTARQKVSVLYEGRLIDGTVFDGTANRNNQPSTFVANQVIKGWTEALCMMPVGSKWELYIPYQLAYGDRDQGLIKPYSALIFTVELISIEPDASAAAQGADKKPADKKPADKRPAVKRPAAKK